MWYCTTAQNWGSNIWVPTTQQVMELQKQESETPPFNTGSQNEFHRKGLTITESLLNPFILSKFLVSHVRKGWGPPENKCGRVCKTRQVYQWLSTGLTPTPCTYWWQMSPYKHLFNQVSRLVPPEKPLTTAAENHKERCQPEGHTFSQRTRSIQSLTSV